MKKMKRVLAMMLSLVLVFAAVPSEVNATAPRKEEPVSYELKIQLKTGGHAKVTYTNLDGVETIDEYDGLDPGMTTMNYTVRSGGQAQVVFTALPGYAFDFKTVRQDAHGHGVEDLSNSFTDFSFDSPTTITSHFKGIDYTVEVASSIGGTATVASGSSAPSVSFTGAYNSPLEFAQSANEGYEFKEWRMNDENGSVVTPPTLLTESGKYYAVFVPVVKQIDVNVSSGLGGSATVNTVSSVTVDVDSIVNLVATPSKHYSFVGWFVDGNLVSSNKNYSPSVGADTTFEARFVIDQFTVAVSATTGGSALVEGLPSVTKDYNTLVNMVATPDEGYKFVKWTRDTNDSTKSTNTNTTTRTKSNKSFTAIFAPKDQYTVTVVLEDETNTYATITGDPQPYYEGENVYVEVGSNNYNTTIDRVEVIRDGDVAGAVIYNGPVSIDDLTFENINHDYVINVYSTTTYNVYTESQNIAQGSTSPTESTYENGQEATVIATPQAGYRFVGWYEKVFSEEQSIQLGNLVSTLPTYSFEVEGTTRLVGVFELIPPTVVVTQSTPPTTYTLTVNVVGGGSVPGFEGTNTFTSGTNVIMNPTPANGFVFSGWTGDTGSLNGNIATIAGNTTLTANFEAIIEDTNIPQGLPQVPTTIEEDTILDEVTPEAGIVPEVPVVNEEDTILDEVTPEGSPDLSITDDRLPQTGGLPLEAMSVLGTAILGFGIKLRKKS